MIKIQKASDGQHYYTVHGKNGEVLVTSETYSTKAMCEKGIAALKSVMVSSVKMVDTTRELKTKKSSYATNNDQAGKQKPAAGPAQ